MCGGGGGVYKHWPDYYCVATYRGVCGWVGRVCVSLGAVCPPPPHRAPPVAATQPVSRTHNMRVIVVLQEAFEIKTRWPVMY